MIAVSRRAPSHEDRSGDPLDGLVNMFDIGIVLSLGFLLAALSSLQLSQSLTDKGLQRPKDQITVPKDSQVQQVPSTNEQVIGQGTEIGKVYRLRDGRLVYVVPKGSPTPGASPSAGTPPTPAG